MSALVGMVFVLVTQMSYAAEGVVDEALTATLEATNVQPEKKFENLPIELGLGGILEFQKTVDAGAYEPKSAPYLQLGIHRGRWVYALDAWQNRESSTAGSLKIESSRTSFDLSVLRLSQSDQKWSPFLGLGLGAYFDQVTTQFGTTKDTTQSNAHINALGKAGVRFRFQNVMYSDVTFRINKRETSRDLEWGASLSIGFHL